MSKITSYELTAEMARELLDYDPKTGILRWKGDCKKNKQGHVAGCLCGNGRKLYVKVRIGRLYRAHRLIWLMVTGEWPETHIDHIDNDGTNNRWGNLRMATSSQNQHNQELRKHNSTGFKGVSIAENYANPFRSSIRIGGKRIHLGYYPTAEGAARAYDTAARKYHGLYARLNFPRGNELSSGAQHTGGQA